MKKVFSILLVAVCCLALATPAQAQLKWGVKGGDNSAGFFIGPMAEFTIPVIGLGIDGAVMYSQRGKEINLIQDSEVITMDAKQQGIEIPVNLKYTIGLGSLLGIYVAAGPDFFFNFKDTKLKGLGNTLNGENVIESKKAQVGVNLGAGLKLFQHLQIGFNYQIPLGDSFSTGEALKAIKDDLVSGKTKTWQIKTKTWQISLAYLF